MVVDHPDGRRSIRYKGVEPPYRTFDTLGQVSQAAIVENKRLGAALAVISRAADRTRRGAQPISTPPSRSARRASVQGRLRNRAARLP
jgi:hypothetical protein